jgi:hypothetical protein
MAEVAYEIRDYVKYLVGSEGFAFSLGWPYHRVCEFLRAADPNSDDLACEIVRRYVNYYRDFQIAGISVDQTALELRKWYKKFTANLGRLSRVLRSGLKDKLTRQIIVYARWRAQSYKYEQYVDLWDFCDILATQIENTYLPRLAPAPKNVQLLESVRAACLAVQNGIDSLVLKSCYSGAAFQYSRGLSVYFPWSEVCEEYSMLAFAVDTQWNQFLREYVALTCREPRDWAANIGNQPLCYTTEEEYMPKFGGTDSTKFGGTDSTKFGGTDSTKTTAQADNMKNPARCFFQQDCVCP